MAAARRLLPRRSPGWAAALVPLVAVLAPPLMSGRSPPRARLLAGAVLRYLGFR